MARDIPEIRFVCGAPLTQRYRQCRSAELRSRRDERESGKARGKEQCCTAENPHCNCIRYSSDLDLQPILSSPRCRPPAWTDCAARCRVVRVFRPIIPQSCSIFRVYLSFYVRHLNCSFQMCTPQICACVPCFSVDTETRQASRLPNTSLSYCTRRTCTGFSA